jgi:hypothetical protein
MFRTAILRSSAAVARTAALRQVARKPASALSSRTAVLARPSTTLFAAPRAAQWSVVRFYSEGGHGLNKDDVYIRIKTILEGFDKVRCNGA